MSGREPVAVMAEFEQLYFEIPPYTKFFNVLFNIVIVISNLIICYNLSVGSVLRSMQTYLAFHVRWRANGQLEQLYF